jgi:hypothetical protein
MRSLAALILCVALAAVEDMPDWVLPGILATETKSYYREDGSIVYVNQQRGSHGEIGPFQVTKRAFRQVRQPGEQFYTMETDRVFSEVIAVRYLYWLREHHTSWNQAVQAYNAGPHHRSTKYLQAVRKSGGAP